MSLRTQIRGYTLWVNLRLQPTSATLSNVAVDILKSFHMRALFESVNGHNYDKLDNFDNLTQQQLVTRAERVIEELKKSNLMLPDIDLDTAMFSMKKYDKIFDVLWCFVVHDIYFAWERAYLFAQENAAILLKIPFTFYPEEFMNRVNEGFYKRVGAFKHNLTVATQEQQFGRFMQEMTASIPDKAQETKKSKRKSIAMYNLPNPFPEHDFMKQLNPRVAVAMHNHSQGNLKPSVKYGITPSECIVEMMQIVLRSSKEGQRLIKRFKDLPNLADSRVLCALLNWVYPKDGGAVPSELLLQDRLTVNLTLRTLERVLQLPESPFCAEDLVECDTRSVCAYFCGILLKAFRFRQFQLAERRHASLRFQLIEETAKAKLSSKRIASAAKAKAAALKDSQSVQLLAFDETDTHRIASARSVEVQKAKQNLEDANTEVRVIKVQLSALEAVFPMDMIRKWVKHADRVVEEMRNSLWDRMELNKYERVTLPRPMTLHEFASATATNLALTRGSGFYKLIKLEELMRGRKVLVKRQLKKRNARGAIETYDVWVDNFSGNKEHAEYIEKLLGFDSPRVISVPIDPEMDFIRYAHENMEVFVDIVSGNRELEEGTVILYQAFPRNVNKLCSDVLFKLLADRPDDIRERSRSASPLRRGSRVSTRESYDMAAFKKIVTFIRMRMPQLIVDVRSNQIGDSLLHTAAFQGSAYVDVCEFLLECGCNVNALNTLHQTALHKAVDSQCLETVHLLIEWGADVNVRDRVRCTPFEYARQPELLELCSNIYRHYASFVPAVVDSGNLSLLHGLVEQHTQKRRRASNVRRSSSIRSAAPVGICCVRSQMLNGSTLLHTAARYNAYDLVLKLLLLLAEDYRTRNRLQREATCSALLMHDFFSQSLTGPCNVLDYQQANALHRAKGPAVAAALLDFNVDLRARDNEGNTVLHLLAASDALATCEKLHSAGQRGVRGLSARMKAPPDVDYASLAKLADEVTSTIRALLEFDAAFPTEPKPQSARVASTQDCNRPFVLLENKLFYTAVHCATLKGNTEAVRIFLQFRPSLITDLDQISGNTPVERSRLGTKLVRTCLYLAAANDHVDCARFLKQSGFAFKPSRLVRANVRESDEAEYLVESFLLHRLPCVEPVKTLLFLFESGANVRAKFGPDGDSVLHLAAAFSGVQVLQFVFDYLRLAEVDLCLNERMQSALHSAVIRHNQKAARFLLERGARSTLLDQASMTPFDYIEDYAEWLVSPVFNYTDDDKETYWRKEMRKAQLRNVKNVLREVSMHVLNSEYESIIGPQAYSFADSRAASRLTSRVAVSRASSASVREDAVSPVPSIPQPSERQKSSFVVAQNQRRFLANLSHKLSVLSDESHRMNVLIQHSSPRLKARPKSERVQLRRRQQMRTVLQSARSVRPHATVDYTFRDSVSLTHSDTRVHS